MLHTDLEKSKKQKKKLPKVNKNLKIVSISLLFTLGLIVIGSRLFAADSISWNFDVANDYSLSDSNKIEIAGGEVKLKQVQTTLTDDSSGEFSGTFLNTLYSDNKLTLGSNRLPTQSNSSGIVAQYRMENNWNNELGTNTATTNGSPSFVTGYIGNAGSFDGTDDQVVINSNYGLGITNVSIEAWVNLDSLSENGSFVKVGGTGNGGIAIGVGGSTFQDGGNNLIALFEGVRWIDTNINIGTGWHHVAIVVNSSGLPIIYLDGRYIGAYGGTNAMAPANNNVIIGGYNAGAGNIRYVDAEIDEVTIYNTDLTPERIFNNYNRNIGNYGEYTSPVIDSSAIDGVQWNELALVPNSPYSKELLDNTQAESAYSERNLDMSGNIGLFHFNNNLNDTSGAGITAAGEGSIGFSSTSQLGSHSLYFDGINDRVNLNTANYRFQSGSFSVSGWVNASTLDNTFDGIITTDNAAQDCSWKIARDANQRSFHFKYANSSAINFQSVNTGEWHHYVVVKTGSTAQLYFDGSLYTSATITASHSCGASIATLGTYRTNEAANWFNGYLDELAIFNRALTASEVTNIYTRGMLVSQFQVRNCNDNQCSGENFVGPDGTSNTYFSEFLNQTVGLPSFSLDNEVNRYFQYKFILMTANVAYKPMISSVTTKFTSYALDKPNVNLSSEEDLGAIPASINKFCEGILDVNNSCTQTSTKPANTEIYYQICNDTVSNCNTNNVWKYWDGDSWENANSTQYNTAEDINQNIELLVPQTKYFAFKSYLTSGGQSTPILKDVSISVVLDSTVPSTNAGNLFINGKNSGDWINNKPIIEWNSASDNEGGIGILGYCISLDESNLGTSQNLNPATSAGVLQNIDDGVSQSYCPYIVTSTNINLATIQGLNLTTNKQYNFSIKAVDASGNIWNGSSEEYQDLFTFRYDGTPPTNPAFISMPSNFIQSKDVTITWPIDGSNGASDVGSGLAGLQYRIGQNGTWYGDLHNGNQDLTDLLVNDGTYTTNPAVDYETLVDGSNIIYFRTVDSAGNFSTSNVTGVLKINTTAPGQVQNLQVTPSDSVLNSYSFSWSVPDTFIGESSKLTYCYTINTLPNVNNCTYTSEGITNIPSDAYATQPGTNNFYVVAKDEAGNINFDTYSSVQFTYSGEAPGIPLNLDVADISTKETQDWKLAVTWATPANTGAGVSSYKVFRSIEENAACNVSMSNFTQVSSVLGTSYIDTGLEQRDYYYCVKACDSANNCSAVSSTKFKFPTGKYTSPATLVSGPTLNAVTTKKAVISWVTDRRSDSKIQIGLSSNNYFEAESAVSAQVTSHTVTLDNLAAGTTYYYRAKWTDEDGNTGISDEKSFTTNPPPSIISTNTTNIGINSALLQLRVSGATKATILFGIENNFNLVKEVLTSFTESSYTIPLENLNDNSRYTYRIRLADIEGAEYLNLETNEFTTLPRPIVSNIEIEEVKNVAQPTIKVNWTSNTEVSSIVTYYPANFEDQARDSINLDLIKEHQMELSGLMANTRYVLVVKGVDKFGNEAVSSPQIFNTATDTRPPRIFNVKVEAVNPDSSENTSQIIVSWETDELSTSQIEYGEGTSGSYSQSTQIDKNLGYKHVVIITNLKPASVYHLKAISEDNSKNTTETGNIVTITPKQQEKAFDIVLKGLGDIFSFL